MAANRVLVSRGARMPSLVFPVAREGSTSSVTSGVRVFTPTLAPFCADRSDGVRRKTQQEQRKKR